MTVKWFRHFGAEVILTAILAPFIVWVVASIYSLQTEAKVANEKIARTVSIEAKVDYIYQYLIENNKRK